MIAPSNRPTPRCGSLVPCALRRQLPHAIVCAHVSTCVHLCLCSVRRSSRRATRPERTCMALAAAATPSLQATHDAALPPALPHRVMQELVQRVVSKISLSGIPPTRAGLHFARLVLTPAPAEETEPAPTADASRAAAPPPATAGGACCASGADTSGSCCGGAGKCAGSGGCGSGGHSTTTLLVTAVVAAVTAAAVSAVMRR